jgi:hypothetical protein
LIDAFCLGAKLAVYEDCDGDDYRLSISDALRCFSIRSLVAAQSNSAEDSYPRAAPMNATPWQGSEWNKFGHTKTFDTIPLFADRAAREVMLFWSSSDVAELIRAGVFFRTEVPFSYPESTRR